MSYGCHPLVAVLGILGPQLQGLLVLVVEINGKVMLREQTEGEVTTDSHRVIRKALYDPLQVT